MENMQYYLKKKSSHRRHRLNAVLCSLPDNIPSENYQLYVVVSNKSDRLTGKYPALVQVSTESTSFQG